MRIVGYDAITRQFRRNVKWSTIAQKEVQSGNRQSLAESTR
jgi:hypothetical protein